MIKNNNQSAINHEPSTILVTGGAGYIGSFTVKELIDHGYTVVVLDSLENGHKEAVDPRAKLEIVDLKDKEKTRRVFDKYHISAVVDFAAYLVVGESMEQPEKYMENNVVNFVNLLDIMAEKGCRHIIKSSTAATYGTPPKKSYFPLKEDYQDKFKPKESALLAGKWQGEDVEGEEFFQKFMKKYESLFENRPELQLSETELVKLRIPSSIYGLSKLLDEIIMEKYSKESKINYVSLRYFNVCGASENGHMGEDHPNETHLIPLALRNILSRSEFRLTGYDFKTKDGTAIRDYIHVADLANGHLKALEYLIKSDQNNIFNLGNGTGYSVKEVIQSIEKILKKKVNYKMSPRRPGDPETLIASPLKAEKTLGWKAKFSLRDMVRSAWSWHKNNPQGYLNK